MLTPMALLARIESARDAVGTAVRLTAAGVAFRTPPNPAGPPTARCLVFVTPDAQRTMATYLGAAGQLTADDVDPKVIEAYLGEDHTGKFTA